MAQITIKCYLNNEVRLLGSHKASITLKSLKKKLKKEYKRDLDIKYKDADGDLIAIRKPSHLRDAVRNILDEGGHALRLHLIDKPNTISLTESDILESLVSAAVVIDTAGKILLFNTSAEKLLGYDRKEVVGKNVKVLMPSSDAADHDKYLQNYLKTGKAKIIGTGRQVVAQRKDGSSFAINLCVSENKAPNHHTFCGTLQEIATANEDGRNSTVNPYALLESILDTTIVINDKGIVQFFNAQAEKFFGYSRTDVIGRNVKVLMPSPFAEQHDSYIKNYLETHEAKIIGTGRDVICQLKDGTIVPVNLSITELKKGTGKMFTGILRPIEQEKPMEKSILQAEREVLDNLVVPAVVIDEKGTIHAFNKPSQQLFGYSLIDVVGKNVNMLMPSPDSGRHNSYLSEYIRTGKSKVIGTGRDVVALHKDGSMLALHLSVTERTDGDKRIFTGLLQKLK